MIVRVSVVFRVLVIYTSDFNVCTDRTTKCFNMSSQRGRKNNVVLKMLLQRRAKAQQEIIFFPFMT